MGVCLDSKGVVILEVRKMAVTDLAELYNRCKCTHTQAHTQINTFQAALLHLEQP